MRVTTAISKPGMGRRTRRVGLLIPAVTFALLATGCAAETTTTTQSSPTTSTVNNAVDPFSLDAILDHVEKQGLPVTGAKDTTDQTCATAKCDKAVTADQLTIARFASTGRAEVYAGTQEHMFQVLDIVVTFPADTSPAAREQYSEAVKSALH